VLVAPGQRVRYNIGAPTSGSYLIVNQKSYIIEIIFGQRRAVRYYSTKGDTKNPGEDTWFI